MANHAPLITTLRPGILRVVQEKGTSEYVVTGGFAELVKLYRFWPRKPF